MMKRIAQWATAALSMILIVLACGKDDGPSASEAKAPNIESHTESGPVGSTLIINGTHFGASIAENTVTLNGVAVTLSAANTTKLTGEVPANATTGKIKVTTAGGSDTSEDDFEVTTGDGNTTLSLNKTTLTLYPYEHYIETLEATTNIENPTISWTSSDTDVATVDENGEVTPLTLGTTTITASLNGVTAECVITVADGPVTLLEIIPEVVELYREETEILELEIVAEVESTSVPEWHSDNEDVVIVDQEGQVTAVAPGTAEITVAVDNEMETRTVKVKPDVYIAGYENRNSIDVAIVWKNKEVLYDDLTDGAENGRAYAVFTDGIDVYTSGYQMVNGIRVAKIWKNGLELYALTNGENEANALSVFLDGSDVYSTGFESPGPTIWKNGELHLKLSNQLGAGRSILVDGNDIYVAGYSGGEARQWENETAYNLGQGDSAYSMDLNGDDVYVAGRGNSRAKIWKNKTPLFTNGNNLASANSVYAVNETMVYSAGYEQMNGVSKAKVWENNTELYAFEDNGLGSIAQSIAVYGADIFTVGHIVENVYQIPTLWEHEVAYSLLTASGTHGEALAVYVK